MVKQNRHYDDKQITLMTVYLYHDQANSGIIIEMLDIEFFIQYSKEFMKWEVSYIREIRAL